MDVFSGKAKTAPPKGKKVTAAKIDMASKTGVLALSAQVTPWPAHMTRGSSSGPSGGNLTVIVSPRW